MPILLIIKLVVSIIFYVFLVIYGIELIKVKGLNKKIKNIKDNAEVERMTKEIKKKKNLIKFLLFGILFLLIVSIITSGFVD